MSLAEFYATNYSKCNLTQSFLASWRGLAYPCHLIQILALPIQIFTFYIIMKHTPVPMKMMKSPLLINHFCCSFLDFLICTMSTPYVFLHNVGFLGLGIFHWLGVSQMFQFVTGLATVLLVFSSYIYLFEARSSSLQLNRFKMTRKWVRCLYHLGIYAIGSSILEILIFRPKNQLAAKLEALSFDPCPTREYFDNDVFILTTDPNIIHFVFWFLCPFIILHTDTHILFHVICTVYYLYITPNKSTSRETRKSQQKFFKSILFQTTIPSIFLLSFFSILFYDFITGKVSQQMINTEVILAATHGIVESVTILLVHGPYRKAVWSILTRKRTIKVQSVNLHVEYSR